MLIIFLYVCDMTALYYHYLWTIGIGFINTAAFIAILTTTSLIFMISFCASWINTKRERFYISKPGTVRETGIVRLIIPAGFWLIPAITLTAAELIMNSDPENRICTYIISLTGIILLFNSNFCIVKDMAYVTKRKRIFLRLYNDQIPPLIYFTIIFVLLLFAALSSIGVESSDPFGAFNDLFFSGFSPIILIVSGFIFSYFSLIIYQRRIEFQD